MDKITAKIFSCLEIRSVKEDPISLSEFYLWGSGKPSSQPGVSEGGICQNVI